MDGSPAPNRPLWLPNALVWVRLALAGVFVALLASGVLDSPARLTVAAGIFVVAAITDAIDGNLARRWNAVTRFGRVMDPLADKILVLGGFVCLAGPAFAHPTADGTETFQASGVYPWMVVLILSRELLVTTLRGLVEGEGGDFSAIKIGKLKMVAQSIAIPLILIVLAFGPWETDEPGRLAIDITAWGTAIVTVVSGVPYVRRAFGNAP